MSIKFGEKDMTKNDDDLTPVEFIEKYYPETANEFKMIQDEQYFVRKLQNHNYHCCPSHMNLM